MQEALYRVRPYSVYVYVQSVRVYHVYTVHVRVYVHCGLCMLLKTMYYGKPALSVTEICCERSQSTDRVMSPKYIILNDIHPYIQNVCAHAYAYVQ